MLQGSEIHRKCPDPSATDISGRPLRTHSKLYGMPSSELTRLTTTSPPLALTTQRTQVRGRLTHSSRLFVFSGRCDSPGSTFSIDICSVLQRAEAVPSGDVHTLQDAGGILNVSQRVSKQLLSAIANATISVSKSSGHSRQDLDVIHHLWSAVNPQDTRFILRPLTTSSSQVSAPLCAAQRTSIQPTPGRTIGSSVTTPGPAFLPPYAPRNSHSHVVFCPSKRHLGEGSQSSDQAYHRKETATELPYSASSTSNESPLRRTLFAHSRPATFTSRFRLVTRALNGTRRQSRIDIWTNWICSRSPPTF
ncbi:hypothetical protein GY45DRAFT_142314 [Cubamyces sp. BRFM 1775]|nr:hypothetical protein GY45DRAFT_142314 [Cubamyces sp. BRFM 1775]